jgi:hypothetical protein
MPSFRAIAAGPRPWTLVSQRALTAPNRQKRVDASMALFLSRCAHLFLLGRQPRIAMSPCGTSFMSLWNSIPGTWIKLR